jgi:hypothetical protein
VDHFAEQPEVRIQVPAALGQLAQEALFQQVGHIQAQPVQVELPHPALHRFQEVCPDLGIARVELGELGVPFPVVVEEGVAQGTAGAEIHAAEPVAVRGGLPLDLQVAEGPEVTADVMEHAVQDQADAAAVQLRGQGGKRGVVTQAPVHPAVVGRVVAVAGGLEQRPQIQGVHSELR